MHLFFHTSYNSRTGSAEVSQPISGGIPLKADKKQFWEKKFQADFSGVLLYHVPGLSGMGVAACASGDAVYYALPLTESALEHELGHVVQQRRAGLKAVENQPLLLVDDPSLERDPGARPDILRDLGSAGYRVAQPIKMRYGWCNYAHILSAMDDAVEAVGGGSDPYAGKQSNIVQFRMRSGANWAYLANRKSLKAPGRLPCDVQVINGTPVACATGGAAGGERVFFPGQRDLNYRDVGAGVAQVITAGDAALAQLMLDRAAGRNTQQGNQAQMAWIDCLIVLLFGMETARFQSGLCTTVLFLDLIASGKAYGRTGRRFGFGNAFHTGSWEDGEWYGGKYPYATHGTGSGNNYMRTVLANDYQMVLGDHFAGLPQRHAVPRREVTLCVHWLESALGPYPDLYDDDLYRKVQHALSARLNDFYLNNNPNPNLPYAPNPASGVSAFGDDKGVKAPLPGLNGTVYWHKVNYANVKATKYYHARSNPLCGARTGIAKGPALIAQEKENFQRTLMKQGKDLEKAAQMAFSRPDWNATREESMSAGNWFSCTRRDVESARYKPCPKCFNI